MNEAARTFVQRVLASQTLIGLVAFFTVALLAQPLLLLERNVALDVLTTGATLALLALAMLAALSYRQLRGHRYVLRALALGSTAVEPDDLRRLADLASDLTARFMVVMSLDASLMLVPGIRPIGLDPARGASLLVLVITIFGAAAIPHYVVSRAAAIRVIELGPLEPITSLLERDEVQALPRARVMRRLLVAVVVPVALVGVGALLITYAHLRTLVEESQRRTALVVARTALAPGPGAVPEAGTDEAIVAATSAGYATRIDRRGDRPAPQLLRGADGELEAWEPIEGGRAVVRFTAALSPSVTTSGAAVAMLAVAVAVALGMIFGRALADDLTFATRRVRLLGTETVLRGPPELARPARFRVVADLGRAIEVLAERFRVFAEAQERAIEAREAAQRMRGLLFASVSHDLKSPLNAILGFAEIVGREPLSSAQKESLALIETRGRELLALIETILDAARVEVGQLTLLPRPTEPGVIVRDAIRKAYELASDTESEAVMSVEPDLPSIPVDPVHVTRSVAVVIAHALRAGTSPTGKPVWVHAERAGDSPDAPIRINVEHATAAVSVREIEELFTRQSSTRARGLTLGLSLARSVIELHGGSVQVRSAEDGSPIVTITLTIIRPRLPARAAHLSRPS